MAISVVVAVGDVGDKLVDASATRLPKLKVGDGAEPGTDMGPLITSERDKVTGYIQGGIKAGAIAIVDGRGLSVGLGGYFLGPTLLDHVTPDMRVYTPTLRTLVGALVVLLVVELLDDEGRRKYVQTLVTT
jgi:malonate-semialdehyde dehydrogenase (acetylating) / methylmalonate-semialdehyde dehydrogenase